MLVFFFLKSYRVPNDTIVLVRRAEGAAVTDQQPADQHLPGHPRGEAGELIMFYFTATALSHVKNRVPDPHRSGFWETSWIRIPMEYPDP